MTEYRSQIMDIFERVNRHTKALGFIADHVQDLQASMALATIEDDMEKTCELFEFFKNLP